MDTHLRKADAGFVSMPQPMTTETGAIWSDATIFFFVKSP